MARILITSAIPYINGIKHLGNLVGSQLPADLFARYNRARGHEVMFICATDEHGTPAELAAAKAGKPVAEYCAEMHEVQAEIARGFRLSLRPLRAQLLVPAQPQADPGLLPAVLAETGPDPRSQREDDLFRSMTTASCPTAISRAPARTAALTPRAATNATIAPSSWTRPT